MNALTADHRAAASENQAPPLDVLLDRLRRRLAGSEADGERDLRRLQATLTRVEHLPGGLAATVEQAERAFERPVAEGPPGARLRGLATEVLGRQRGAAREMFALADELRALAGALERRLLRPGDAAQVRALQAMEAEARALGVRLEARLAAGEGQAARVLGRLADRLGQLQVVAGARASRAGEPAPPAARFAPRGAQRPPPRTRSRSAAFLVSACLACMGVIILAAALRPVGAPWHP